MREGATQRLAGAVIIVALAVIFVPMLFEPKPLEGEPEAQGSIPPAPAFDPDLKTEVFLGPADSGVGGLGDEDLTETQPLALPPVGDLDAADSVASLEPPPPEGGSASQPEVEPGPPRAVKPKAERDPAPAPDPGPKPIPPRGAADGMPSWVVQVASLATPESAAQVEARLRASGFTAFVEPADVNGRRYYRVIVGPEVDRANAERTAARLHERHKLDTLIKGYP